MAKKKTPKSKGKTVTVRETVKILTGNGRRRTGSASSRGSRTSGRSSRSNGSAFSLSSLRKKRGRKASRGQMVGEIAKAKILSTTAEAAWMYGWMAPTCASRGPGDDSEQPTLIGYHTSMTRFKTVASQFGTAVHEQPAVAAVNGVPLNTSGTTGIYIGPLVSSVQKGTFAAATPVETFTPTSTTEVAILDKQFMGFSFDPGVEQAYTLNDMFSGSHSNETGAITAYQPSTLLGEINPPIPFEGIPDSSLKSYDSGPSPLTHRLCGMRVTIKNISPLLVAQGAIKMGDTNDWFSGFGIQNKPKPEDDDGIVEIISGNTDQDPIGECLPFPRIIDCGGLNNNKYHESIFVPMSKRVLEYVPDWAHYPTITRVHDGGTPVLHPKQNAATADSQAVVNFQSMYNSTWWKTLRNTPGIIILLQDVPVGAVFEMNFECSFEYQINRQGSQGLWYATALYAYNFLPQWSVLKGLVTSGALGTAAREFVKENGLGPFLAAHGGAKYEMGKHAQRIAQAPPNVMTGTSLARKAGERDEMMVKVGGGYMDTARQVFNGAGKYAYGTALNLIQSGAGQSLVNGAIEAVRDGAMSKIRQYGADGVNYAMLNSIGELNSGRRGLGIREI